MIYGPSAVQQLDLSIAAAPFIGCEFAAYISRIPAYLLGTIAMTNSGTGTYTASNATSIVPRLPAGAPVGANLQLVPTTELRSPGGNVVVVFNVVNDQSVTTTLTFTFAPPARAADQSGNFARGYAVDGVLASGSYVKSVTGLASVSNGYSGVGFGLYQLPEAADYVLVATTKEKKFNLKSAKAVGIRDGREETAFVKRGVTMVGEVTLDANFVGMADRLTRFDGARSTLMLVGLKDGEITTDRLVFTNYTPNVAANLGDADGEAVENAATGLFQDHLFFVAP
jgi:hypothetical protein